MPCKLPIEVATFLGTVKHRHDGGQTPQNEVVEYVALSQTLQLFHSISCVGLHYHVAGWNVLQQRLVLVVHDWQTETTQFANFRLKLSSLEPRFTCAFLRSNKKQFASDIFITTKCVRDYFYIRMWFMINCLCVSFVHD